MHEILIKINQNHYDQSRLLKKQLGTYQYFNNKLKTLKIRIGLSASSIFLQKFTLMQTNSVSF